MQFSTLFTTVLASFAITFTMAMPTEGSVSSTEDTSAAQGCPNGWHVCGVSASVATNKLQGTMSRVF